MAFKVRIAIWPFLNCLSEILLVGHFSVLFRCGGKYFILRAFWQNFSKIPYFDEIPKFVAVS
jgi:hypothetical protein